MYITQRKGDSYREQRREKRDQGNKSRNKGLDLRKKLEEQGRRYEEKLVAGLNELKMQIDNE